MNRIDEMNGTDRAGKEGKRHTKQKRVDKNEIK